ncbi:MAG TPA: helix-hairpin-helix domain-containing protein [Deltaproteobacteria bacterium]|nr:helix-hairpin-helix domain-containing protein [Deltaproteobacteria bacterium]
MAYGQSSTSPSQGMQQGTSGSAQGAGAGMGQPIEKISVNTATAQELQSVPGIDQTLAQNILDYRMANGAFSSIDDLSKVQGMDKQKLDSLRKYLEAKLDLNVATADQLRRVPGVSRSLAQNIIQYREANGPFASVDNLNRIRGIDNYKLDLIKKYVQVGGS